MWLNECFLNSWHYNYEASMKCIRKVQCFCNLCVTKVNDNLKITSVRSSLDLNNKFELEKFAFKKNKKHNFKRLFLKSWGKFRVKTNIFRKFIQFSSKQVCFLHALPTWKNGRGLRPLQPPVPLLPARRAQRVRGGRLFKGIWGKRSFWKTVFCIVYNSAYRAYGQ